MCAALNTRHTNATTGLEEANAALLLTERAPQPCTQLQLSGGTVGSGLQLGGLSGRDVGLYLGRNLILVKVKNERKIPLGIPTKRHTVTEKHERRERGRPPLRDARASTRCCGAPQATIQRHEIHALRVDSLRIGRHRHRRGEQQPLRGRTSSDLSMCPPCCELQVPRVP